MTAQEPFASWLGPYFQRFVDLKRATGRRYLSQHRLLRHFDRYLAQREPCAPLRCSTLLDYLESLEHLSPRARDNVIGVVWPAVVYAKGLGAKSEPIPERPVRPARFWRQREPRILSRSEAEQLIAAARKLPPEGSLRPATTATLIGLLITTGIRIGEALDLDVGDLDRHHRLLTIRNGKFGKSRILPLRSSVLEALAGYLDGPLRKAGSHAAEPFFVSSRRRRLSYSAARSAFVAACHLARLEDPQLRPHDLRHRFAVTRVATWYRQGRDVNSLLPALSTYLGHISVENTRLYLIANSALFQLAAQRFDEHALALDELLS